MSDKGKGKRPEESLDKQVQLMSMSTPPEGDESPPIEMLRNHKSKNKKDKRRDNLIATDLSDEFGKAASNSPFFMVGQDQELMAAVNNQPITLEKLG